MRFLLAFSSFFRLLFGLKLNPKVVAYLPDQAVPRLPESTAAAAAKPEPAEPAKPRPEPARAAERRPPGEHREGALAMLGLLQREGRLIDFLLETIDDYDDAAIGAAVRDIHRGCRKALSDHISLEAVMPGEEDEAVDVPRGFDPGEIRLVGDVSGDPPFHGVLRHHGWRATEIKLPTLSDGVDRRILAPAEVEIGSRSRAEVMSSAEPK